MTYIFSYLLGIGNLMSSVLKKKSKLLSVLLVLFMWILFWGNTGNPDYHVYNSMYISNAETTTLDLELGFVTLIKIGNFIGINYQIFTGVISLIGISLIHKTIREYTENYNIIYLLYFLSPFFVDVIQIRNFLAMSILIFSTQYLLGNKKAKYLICILIASTIQVASIAYFILIIINGSKNNKVVLKAIVIISILLSVISLFNNKEVLLLDSIVSLSDSSKIEVYVSTKTNWGFLLFWGMHILSSLIMYLTRKIDMSINVITEKDHRTSRFIELTFWINIILIVYFPLYLLNSNFFRISRNILMLNYISFAILIDKLKIKENRIIYIVIIAVYVGINFYFTVFTEQLHVPILNNNSIL